MEPRLINSIPPELRRLVEEIEQSAGAEIAVEVHPALRTPQAASPTTRAGIVGPTVQLRSEAEVSASSDVYPVPFMVLAHELLHLRRYFVEWIPFTDIRGFELGHKIECENTLEHLIIDRRISKYVGRSPDYSWLIENWRQTRATGCPDIAGRWDLILAWLATAFLSTPEAIGEAMRVLRAEGILEQALWLRDVVGALVQTSKEATAIVVGQTIGIPVRDSMWFTYYRPDPAHPGKVLNLSAACVCPISISLPGGGELTIRLEPLPEKKRPKMPRHQWKRRKKD